MYGQSGGWNQSEISFWIYIFDILISVFFFFAIMAGQYQYHKIPKLRKKRRIHKRNKTQELGRRNLQVIFYKPLAL
jgi:hypothetical protein